MNNYIEAGLSLGTNLGDRIGYLREATAKIGQIPGIEIVAQSPIYETEPVGVKPEYQHLAYLNAALVLSITISPDELSEAIHQIETDMGRSRGNDRYAPRPIDIDILYVGQFVRQTAELTLPHPEWAHRRFVLQPLADIRPHLQLPGVSADIQTLLAQLPKGEAVTPIKGSL